MRLFLRWQHSVKGRTAISIEVDGSVISQASAGWGEGEITVEGYLRNCFNLEAENGNREGMENSESRLDNTYGVSMGPWGMEKSRRNWSVVF